MVEESSYATMSLHLSEQGAKDAMKKHMDEAMVEWIKEDNRRREEFGDDYCLMSFSPFGTFQDWDVMEVKALP